MTLGLGSVVSAAVAAAPWVAVASRHKGLVFAASGLLLALNYWLVVVRPRRCGPGEACHVDSPGMRWSRRLFAISAAVYVIAAFLTFGTALVVERL